MTPQGGGPGEIVDGTNFTVAAVLLTSYCLELLHLQYTAINKMQVCRTIIGHKTLTHGLQSRKSAL